jgi:hypothetical protein
MHIWIYLVKGTYRKVNTSVLKSAILLNAEFPYFLFRWPDIFPEDTSLYNLTNGRFAEDQP